MCISSQAKEGMGVLWRTFARVMNFASNVMALIL